MLRKKGSCPVLVTSTEFVLWYRCVEEGVNRAEHGQGGERKQMFTVQGASFLCKAML